MIVQLSILCVIAILSCIFIKLSLPFKNILNMCMNSALLSSNKANKLFSTISYLPSMQNGGLRSYCKAFFFTELLHKVFVFLLEMFIITESITQCNLDDNHT